MTDKQFNELKGILYSVGVLVMANIIITLVIAK